MNINSANAQQIGGAITPQQTGKVAELLVLRLGSPNKPWLIELQGYEFSNPKGTQQQLTITSPATGDLRFWEMHEDIDLECTLKVGSRLRSFKAHMQKAYERDIKGSGLFQCARFNITSTIDEHEQVLDFNP